MPSWKWWFLALFSLCILLSAYYLADRIHGPLASSSSFSSATAAASAKKLSILFIGNSYIFVNNLPKMIADIASSDPGNSVQIETQAVTKGGAHLSELLQAGDAVRMIHSRHWDYVVLQEQSTWAIDEDEVKNTFQAAGAFANDIREAGSMPVLYLTWMRKPGSKWYQPPFVSQSQSPEHMQYRLDYYTTALGQSLHALVVPAGDAWALMLKNHPMLPLYQEDGSHPTTAGTYLVALMFYHFLTHNPVQHVHYLPPGVDSEGGRYVRELVETYKVPD